MRSASNSILATLVLWIIVLVPCATRADMARWNTLMEEGRQAAVLDDTHVVYGDWPLAVRKMTAAVRVAESSFGAYDPRLAESLDELAYLYLHPGEFDYALYFHLAEHCILRAKAIRVADYGAKSPEIAPSLCMIAHMYTHMDDNEKSQQADALYQRAIALTEKGFGPNNPKLANVLCMAALYYVNDTEPESSSLPLGIPSGPSALSEHGVTMFQRAVRIVEHAYGPNDPRIIPVLNAIAHCDAECDPQTTADNLQRAVHVSEKTYGQNDQRILPALYRLAAFTSYGYALKSMPDDYSEIVIPDGLPQPEMLYQRAVSISEAAYGHENPAIIPALLRLAEFYHATKRDEEAWPLFERALAIAEGAYGKSDPRILDSLLALADWSANANPSVAEELYQRAVHICETIRPIDTGHLFVALSGLAMYYQQDGQPAQELNIVQRQLQLTEQSSSIDLPDTLGAYRLLAGLSEENYQLDTDKYADRFLTNLARRYGKSSDEYLWGLQALTSQYEFSMVSPKKQLQYHQQLINIQGQRFGIQNAEYLEGLRQLASAYNDAHDDENAITTYQRAITLGDRMGQTNTLFIEPAAELLVKHHRYADAQPLLNRLVASASKRVWEARKQGAVSLEDDQLSGYINAQRNSAQNLIALKRFSQAELIYKTLLMQVDQHQNDTRSKSQQILRDLAECYRQRGNYSAAEKCLLQAQAIVENNRKHSTRYDSRGSLSEILGQRMALYGAWGQPSKAQACQRRLFTFIENNEINEAYPAFRELDKLAGRYADYHAYQQASDVLTRLLATQKHPAYDILFDLATINIQQKHPDIAESYIKRLQTCIEADLAAQKDRDLPDMSIEYYDKIIDFYRQQRRYDTAEQLVKRKLQYNEDRRGQRDFQTALQLANLYVEMQRFSEAEVLLQQIIRESQLIEHEKEGSTGTWFSATLKLALANCYAAWHKPEQALPLYEEAMTHAVILYRHKLINSLQEYVSPYASLLRSLHRDAEAAQLEKRAKQIEN